MVRCSSVTAVVCGAVTAVAGWSLWSWHFQLQSVAMAALGVGRGCYEVQVHHAQGIAELPLLSCN